MKTDDLKALKHSFRECFSSKAGKVVLEYLQDTYHIHTSTMRSTTGAVEFSEGQRTVVLDIQDLMEIEQEGSNG